MNNLKNAAIQVRNDLLRNKDAMSPDMVKLLNQCSDIILTIALIEAKAKA